MDLSTFSFHLEVLEVLESGLPVIALESTFIALEMPYPENLIGRSTRD